MAKDLLEAQATQAEPKDLLAPDQPQVKQPAAERRNVYLADRDLLVDHPADMSPDRVNAAIQLDVYKRPRFNFYEDVAVPMAQGGIAGVGAQAARKDGTKAITEPVKAVLRAGEQQIALIGALSRWFGENLKRQSDTLLAEPGAQEGWHDAKVTKAVSEKMIAWGSKHYEYWTQQQNSGIEAPDPEMWAGSFLQNPSVTRGFATVAQAIPSLAAMAGITFLTKNPVVASAAFGLTEGAGEATATLDAGKSLDTANAVGAANTVMLTLLDSFSLGSFLKKEGFTKGAIKEGLTEPMQQAATNMIAKIGYDKTRNIMDGVFEAFLAGAGSGGIVGAFTKGGAAALDDKIQDAHNAGVDYADINALRDGQVAVIVANAQEIDQMLDREAAAQAEKIEVVPAEQEADLQRQKELDTIETMIEEEKAQPEVDEENVAALEEMKRQREMDAPVSPVQQELMDIQEKINEFNAEGKPVPDSLVKRQEAILKGLESPPTEGAPLSKKAIRTAVGVDDTSRKRMVSEMQSLKQDLRAQARGAKAGFRAGLKAGKAKIIQALQLGEMKRDAIVDYINKVLPKSERGRFITVVRDAKNSTDLAKAFMRIDNAEGDFTRKTIINDIKKQLAKVASAKNISIDVKNSIESMASLFDTSVPRAETLKRLQTTENFIKAEIAKGNDVEIPSYILEQVQRLKKMPLAELQTDGLYYLANNIRDAIELGKTKLKTRRAIVELRKENMLTELEADTDHQLDSKEVGQKAIGKPLSLPDAFKNRFFALRNYAVTAGEAMKPMDHFFASMGEAYHRIFKRTMDVDYKAYRPRYAQVSTEIDALNEKLNLDENNWERIAVALIDKQENGREKLLNVYKEAELDKVTETLTPQEREAMAYVREKLDDVFPELEKFMNEVHNKPLGKVVGYFPFVTDSQSLSDMDIAERLSQSLGLRKNIEMGMLQERLENATGQRVRIDGLNIFLEHMDNAYYAIHMGADIKMLQELAGSDRYKKAAGDIGQSMTREWLDLMARKGGTTDMHRNLTNALAFFRKNTGRAMLVLNPASIVVQATSIMDTAGLIGNYAWFGASKVANPEWRAFVKANSSELASRVGDDPAFAEANDSVLDKGYAPTKWNDYQTAVAGFIGAYKQYLDEHQIALDFTKPNPDAVIYAERIVRESQASATFKDAPLAVTKGIGLGNSAALAKTLTQFQTPIFFRYANLTTTARRLWQSGDKAGALRIGGYHLAASAAEMLTRNAVKAGIVAAVSAIFSVGFKEKEEKSLFEDYMETLIGNVPYVSNAVSMFAYEKLPAPSLAAAGQLISSLVTIAKSEDPEVRAKWVKIAALELAGIGFGVPLSFKTAGTIKQIEE